MVGIRLYHPCTGIPLNPYARSNKRLTYWVSQSETHPIAAVSGDITSTWSSGEIPSANQRNWRTGNIVGCKNSRDRITNFSRFRNPFGCRGQHVDFDSRCFANHRLTRMSMGTKTPEI